jgi:hypothetical protein
MILRYCATALLRYKTADRIENAKKERHAELHNCGIAEAEFSGFLSNVVVR